MMFGFLANNYLEQNGNTLYNLVEATTSFQYTAKNITYIISILGNFEII